MDLFISCKQDSIPVGCLPPACQPYVFQWPLLDVSTDKGRVCPRSDVRWGGGGTLPCDLSHDACDVTYQPREQTDACDNITFPKLRLRVVIKA